MKTTTVAMNVPDMEMMSIGTRKRRNMSEDVMNVRGMGEKQMTNEEAYKWLYVHFAPCGDETKQDEAVNVALNALAKQIPKNPVVNGDRNEVWTKDSLICPVCNQYFGSVYNVGYCRACGQKLIQKRISVV